ncbi:MAG: ATP-binding cassette domain-containing protein [Pseudomonadota bacterium]
MSNESPIQLQDVSYTYGRGAQKKQILFDVSASIQPGEIVILTGPSGSGKTTLLTLMGALRANQQGELSVLGQSLRGARGSTLVKVRRQIGYIFQSHNLLDSLTITQNVRMALQLDGVKHRDGRDRIQTVLERVGLGDHGNKYPHQLSGGQKQRAGIARALVNRPRVVLADEPTASLDKQSGRDVVELIQELAREEDAAVVLVTHDNRILDVADRILHLEDGHMRSLTEAVSEGTSRMLNLLEKHDPSQASFLATFSFALARVAYADNEVTDDERQAMRRILHDMGDLKDSEVDFIMELSLMQKRAQSELNSQTGVPLAGDRRALLIKSLYAIAEADGGVSDEERAEIDAIAAEFGLGSPDGPAA